jgi:putative hemin transport protein
MQRPPYPQPVPGRLRQAFADVRARHMDAGAVQQQHASRLSEGARLAAFAASMMGPAEAEQAPFSTVTLDEDWGALLRELVTLGPLRAQTHNDHIRMTRTGVCQQVHVLGSLAVTQGHELNLRISLPHWHGGFHVIEHTPEGEQHSLRFFDLAGQLLHCIHAQAQTDAKALEALVQRHARPDRHPLFVKQPVAYPSAQADHLVDCLGLADAWSLMRDTREFANLLRRFGVTLAQSMRLMEGIHTQRTPLVAVQWLLQQAAQDEQVLRITAGNQGCVQIHSGRVCHVHATPHDIQVKDDDFGLRLRTDGIHESWLVSRPTDDGPVTSLELFDVQGGLIAIFQGERQPGLGQSPRWHRLTSQLRPQSCRNWQA